MALKALPELGSVLNVGRGTLAHPELRRSSTTWINQCLKLLGCYYTYRVTSSLQTKGNVRGAQTFRFEKLVSWDSSQDVCLVFKMTFYFLEVVTKLNDITVEYTDLVVQRTIRFLQFLFNGRCVWHS